MQDKAVQQEKQDAEQRAANASLHGFLGANLGAKLMSAEEITRKIGHNIGYPSADEGQKEEERTVLQAAQQRQASKADDDVNGADSQLCQNGKALIVPRKYANRKIIQNQEKGNNGNEANIGGGAFKPEKMRQKGQCERVQIRGQGQTNALLCAKAGKQLVSANHATQATNNGEHDGSRKKQNRE